MKSLRTPLAVVITLLPFAYLALIWNSLPATVPLHYGPNLQPDRFGARSALVAPTAVLAVVSLFVFALLSNLYRFDPKRRDGQDPVFRRLALGLVVFLAALNVLLLTMAQGGELPRRLLFPLLGLLFAYLGRSFTQLQPNYVAGIRLPWTLHNDDNWRRTHAMGGKLWTVGGLAVAVVCLFLPPTAAFVLFIAVTVVLALTPVVYSYRLYKRQG